MQKEDRLDSFVLAETFKYLYLLFADETDLILDLNKFIFTTEGHLMPLSLARLSNRTAVPVRQISSCTYMITLSVTNGFRRRSYRQGQATKTCLTKKSTPQAAKEK